MMFTYDMADECVLAFCSEESNSVITTQQQPKYITF